MSLAQPIQYIVNIEWIDGGRDIALPTDAVTLYGSNPTEAIAKALAVSSSQYREWLEWGGRVQCCALTRKGRRCRSVVPGVRFDTPAKWAKHEGYCSHHEHGPG